MSDLGLVFYNPGRLGLIEKPAFVLSARGYQWNRFRLEDLPAVTRSPWAVGAGVGVQWGRAVIHLTGEWYSAVPRYVVFSTPFADQLAGRLSGEATGTGSG